MYIYMYMYIYIICRLHNVIKVHYNQKSGISNLVSLLLLLFREVNEFHEA